MAAVSMRTGAAQWAGGSGSACTLETHPAGRIQKKEVPPRPRKGQLPWERRFGPA